MSWNSTYIADAVAHLRAIGEPASDELLAHTSPVGWGHIAFSGDFLWDRASAMPIGRRPLNLGRMSVAACSWQTSWCVLQLTFVALGLIAGLGVLVLVRLPAEAGEAVR